MKYESGIDRVISRAATGASRGVVVSLCDLTGVMVMPWVAAGYDAVLVDPQHADGIATVDSGPSAGLIVKIGHIVDDRSTWDALRQLIAARSVVLVAGFPVCTQLAVSGTSRWADKRAADYNFQAKAMQLVHECRVVGELSGAPWFFENPVSAISSIFRKPDHTFHPNEYGGYLPEGDPHPLYPEYFPPQDAYGKKTCIWAGGGFVMPTKKSVPLGEGQTDGQGQSKAHNKLGGKSDKTKNIRSATPRGFAAAVFEANAPHLRSSYAATGARAEPALANANLDLFGAPAP